MAKIKEVIATTASTHNILASGTNITGDISAEEDFRIDGSINGNISCNGKIIIGSHSKTTGEIKCINIEILGCVKGDIFCSEKVILRASAILDGNMKTRMVEIEPGARFTGQCSMNDE
ncbi:cytoskeletal protein CcmA (bactofilin family) [Dysgonomonas hofstadii]|uniref:Cytoskeletal protein CcmA (Bactofilin family) n=1 Tax=Dysgonomonas hofstadii TaxID=637886 RepID=A0A840CNJ2_9BACT|nr:polymer-forming cytoskeletal protein [Dysgonomonas hofstadii]MBB4036671.1 cytoskeletal protein CcmA (bactofilin family) [Dysgonomonas hofstadii]